MIKTKDRIFCRQFALLNSPDKDNWPMPEKMWPKDKPDHNCAATRRGAAHD
jgi:hypothetical protein